MSRNNRQKQTRLFATSKLSATPESYGFGGFCEVPAGEEGAPAGAVLPGVVGGAELDGAGIAGAGVVPGVAGVAGFGAGLFVL